MISHQTIEHKNMRSNEGEIVQVEGGHIVRSTGRKDRHSKVYTSKGPKDRRVRLSAHTAIEFYDVQDRLGYDRPSKAVDWLIKKAKPSIDRLAQLPPWNPISETNEAQEEDQNAGSSSMANIGEQQSESSGYNFHLQNHSPFISPHVDTDPIAFFPTTSSTSSSVNFQSYPPPDIISRTNISTEDLGLSLHSFQDHPGLIHWQSQEEACANQTPSNQNQTLFAGSTPTGFENHYQRIVTWNNEATTDHINRMGFMINSQQQFLGQEGSDSAYSQNGTLQSSFSPSVRSWNDIPMASLEHQRSQQVHQASIFGSRFLSDGLAGFCIPPRIQGEEENHGVASSSASPSSHH